MIRTMTGILFALAALWAAGTQADELETTRDAAGQLSSLLGSYETYQADFIQIVVNENGNEVQETRGSLKAKRPGLFYWETGAPLSQFIVSDGETVEVYDPDLEQVTIHSLDERVQTTPALLLSGEVGNLNESYEVSVRELGESTREFTLVPRSADSLFTSLRLSFYDGELQEMRMQDSLSQMSILSFDDIELNRSIDNSAFRLDYPEGVDVIRDGA
ncbi:outer membrane lipoprotein chaperone LolA [Marinobacter daepoensis]|uniref:Outer-membrane lipoprotein carrier protein n=1 Tax=Marinobacter daepoensis TaxID=262077 RepID=A0ABS3BBG4_9GAMM|nr:outer membrane lipoprotein chaperone LolA [Marinobacter daepoensis]MBN7768959.1 outer membrane lipoprotein chaperone LolA [Marinobacter daepoensis]MBY6032436.1 outer membrane lipoprotein chaperone LolA [Marinobacter daepoensis]MBY6077649.1 outer membrane lipoprotein chaperone LolA [Marinobacter daepoensis]